MIMEDTLKDLVVILTNAAVFSDEIFPKITNLLQGTETKFLQKFISENFLSLHKLEHWTWKMLSEDSYQWSTSLNYYQFFQNFALFNKNLIFSGDEIDVDTKTSLLLPETTDIPNRIFQQIENDHEENDFYFLIISLWFDNLSYLIQEQIQLIQTPIIIHINHSMALKFLMTEQYKIYLIQLQQTELKLTSKQLFFLKICSFSLSSFLFCKKQTFPFPADEILRFLAKDYLELLRLHGYSIQLWNQELFACITHVTNFIHTCCLWRGDIEKHIQILLPSEDISQNHVQLLIHIMSYKPFHQQIISHRSNDATILIDSILSFILRIIENQNLLAFVRSRTRLVETLVTLGETAGNNLINICAYAMLGEILCDNGLRQLKANEHLCGYFFYVLERAWNHPAQIYQRTTVQQLLRGFLTLAKNDSIQQTTANANKIPLLVEILDRYPVIYDILWGLSFNRDIQEQLRSNAEFMLKISHLSQDINNEQMRKTIHGILWNLEVDHDDHTTPVNDNELPFDIMISYSHKEKVLCKKIYDSLIKAGYRVWIDFDQMHGNVMDAMAQAIEQSKAILICMSEQYRRSNYCRAEAYYAFQRQLKLVPILLQENYRPDGWLSFLVGQLFYVNFVKYSFSQAMEMLLKEIQAASLDEKLILPSESEHGKDMISSSLPIPLPLPGSTSVVLSKSIHDWTETEVQEWLIGHNFGQMTRLLSDYNGASLVCLNRYLMDGETEQIIKLLENDSLRRTNESLSLLELARFQALIEKERKSSVDSRRIERIRDKRFGFDCCRIM